MNRNDLARLLDHSVLKPEAVEADIAAGADVVREWRVGCYCVQPWWVRRASAALAGTGAVVASVVGFPHGCDVTPVKADAARRAVASGAGEIDVVAAFGALRSGDTRGFAADIAAVVAASGHAAVKVILEAAPDFYTHVSNFAISYLLYAAIGYQWLMAGATMKPIVWLGFAILLGNFVYESFIPFINTPDPMDAIYGLVGTALGFLVLWVIDRHGLIANPALAKSTAPAGP